MPLFWIVSETEDGKRVFIQESGDPINARLKAVMAGLPGKLTECHELSPAMARTIPKKALGRPLTIEEAGKLLKKMEKP